MAHGVAVDGGIVEGRQVDRRRDVARRARGRRPRSSGTASTPATGAMRSAISASRLVDGQQRAAEGEAVVRELRHGRPSAPVHGGAARACASRRGCRRAREDVASGSAREHRVATAAMSPRGRPGGALAEQRRRWRWRGCAAPRGRGAACRSAARCTSIFGWASRLEALDDDEIDGGEPARADRRARAPARRAARASGPSAGASRPAPRGRRPRGARSESLPGWSTSKA